MNDLTPQLRQQKQAEFVASTLAQQQTIIDWDYSHRCERCRMLHKVCKGGKPCDRCKARNVECLGYRSRHRFPDPPSNGEDAVVDTRDNRDNSDHRDGEEAGYAGQEADEDNGGHNYASDEEYNPNEGYIQKNAGEYRENNAIQSVDEDQREVGYAEIAQEQHEEADGYYPAGDVGTYSYNDNLMVELIRYGPLSIPEYIVLQGSYPDYE